MLAAVSAAVAFNLFHTQPYLSLRIDSGDDLETAALLLLVVGLTVGELALRGRRARAMVAQERQDLASIQGLGALVANGEDADYVLLATSSELTHLLGLVDCRFETEPSDDRILPGDPPRRQRPLGPDRLGHAPLGAALRRRGDPGVVARPAGAVASCSRPRWRSRCPPSSWPRPWRWSTRRGRPS